MSDITKSSILVVDDELSIRESLSLILGEQYNVVLAASGESALKKIVDEKIDMVFLDIRMPGMNGMETLKKIKELDKDLIVIMVTAVNDVQNAGEAIKMGAADYIIKPFNVEDILNMAVRALKKKRSSKEAKEIRAFGENIKSSELIGKSKAMSLVLDIIDKAASEDSSVIIWGEAGVESETAARSIHRESRRSSKPFMAFEIKDQSGDRLRTALFGAGRGTSSETLTKEKGAIEKAGEGTLFLKNIEKLPVDIQKELALALKKGKFRRAGSDIPIALDIRIICSTSADLKKLISEHLFSKELFDEIGGISIEIPSLASRRADLPDLLDHNVRRFAAIYNKEVKGFSEDALEVLLGYPFPGNTEELKIITKLSVMAAGGEVISIKDLPIDVPVRSSAVISTEESKKMNLEEIYNQLETSFIEKILRNTNNDIERTAKILGLSLSALKAKLEPERPAA